MKSLVQIVSLLTLAVLASCSKPEPVKLGFAGGLSGRAADLGIAGRNGAILAIEQKNAAGGINGHPIELVIKDDEHNPETARKITAELIDQGVEAIIGPMTSSIALAILPLVSASKTILISPTAIAAELGGDVKIVKTFNSGKDAVFFESAKELLAAKPDMVLIVGNAFDAAMICQQIRKIGSEMPIVTTEWGSTERFIELGGDASEGVHGAQFLNRNDTSERYQAFLKAFRQRFGTEPGFAGAAGYDAAPVALEGLVRRRITVS